MLGDFSPDIPMKITLMNGLHQDSLGPAVLSQWVEFLDFYVAKKIPSIPPATRALASAAARPASSAPARRSRPTASPTSPTTRRRCARTRPSRGCACCSTSAPAKLADARVLDHRAGVPASRHHRDHLVPRRRRHAHRRPRRPASGADRFQYDPSAFPRTMTTVKATTSSRPRTAGSRCPAGKALGYVTEPLAADTVLAGTGSVDLWVRSSKPDVDLEVTISEVRPDGQETYVQSGWLRASQRALDAGDVDRPAPGPDPHRAPTSQPLPDRRRRAGAGPALPVRARVPRRVPDPDRRAAAGRQPTRRGRSPRCRHRAR